MLYDDIGRTYEATRQEDPRIAARIWDALGDARTVVNVGAGTGNYEPRDREVVAVEPSEVMIVKRPPGSAPVVQAVAETLPFEDVSFDAAMGVLTDHHWTDRAAGLREMRRVARRVVLFTFDVAATSDSWIVRDYFPQFREAESGLMPVEEVAEILGGARVVPVPIPHDCRDGFFHAWWRRPQAYLDPQVRAGISVFSKFDATKGLALLAADLESGEWERRNGHLLELDELDLGYRLLLG
jgi:SAM-dependent methyltransferase